MPTIQLRIYEGLDRKASISADGEVECGRQDPKIGDPDPITLYQCEGRNRLVLIPPDEKKYSRKWFSVCCDEEGRVTVRNLHKAHELLLHDGRQLGAGRSETFDSEVTINLGSTRSVRVSSEAAADEPSDANGQSKYRLLESLPLAPGTAEDVNATLTLGQFAQSEGEAVVDLMKIALKVVQQASNSDAFYAAATQACTEIVGLDRAAIILWENAPSKNLANDTSGLLPGVMAAEFRDEGVAADSAPPISRTILEHVQLECRTQIHDPQNRSFDAAHSVAKIHSIVASPIMDCHRNVIGVLYGDRWSGSSAGGNNCISDLEGTLVEVLAGAVSGGIARKEEERLRNNLAGFFSPRVANLLATRPELLRGQDATVTVLFCDVRGFSSVTERLGPEKTIEWIRDVLTELSRCVVDRDGVLVDYVGDELMAMWGAPNEQPDHARRAVEASIAMLQAIKTLRQRWADRLPQRFGAGIGINTGIARVGDVGSELKFKYGVLGNTVNGGSRLQAATKQLAVDCLASEQTIKIADCRDRARRLAKLQVVGIEQPIDVYDIAGDTGAEWSRLCQGYEEALADYESQQFAQATKKLGTLVQEFPQDRPSQLLLTKAVAQINQPNDEFSPVWVLTRK